jgi:pullulanase/glycogen debranching enzyme
MQNLGVSLVTLGQGIPFLHAGMEMLRSKSLDRNSYNSGDWFNKLDFTYQSNNFGVGLPPAGDNQSNWPLMQPLLANPALTPATGDIAGAVDHARETLAIRKSTKLFRLRTAAEINSRVRFHNTGPGQVPGLIVMSVSDDDGAIDRTIEKVVVAFNADVVPVDFTVPALAGVPLVLHPLQAASADPVVRGSAFAAATGTLTVPERTAAVFWAVRPLTEQLDLLIADVEALVAGGTLNGGNGNALTAKLRNAQKKIEQGKPGPAANMLGAFVNQVEAFVNAGKLTSEQGAALIAAAEEVIAQL